MRLIFLLLLCLANTDCAIEGDSCTKEGVAGVCTNITGCPDAQRDIENKKHPVLCDFTHEDPIVCCISSITVTTPNTPKGKCIVPPSPEHGSYVTNIPNSKPGEEYDFLAINVTCEEGYIVHGLQSVFCQNDYGWWPAQMPKCVSACHLMSNPSVEYSCLVSDDGMKGTRPCKEYEPNGTVIRPRCQESSYNPSSALPLMHCNEGTWSYVAKCIPECGIVTPDVEGIRHSSSSVQRGAVPWHVGVYTKTTQPYRQIGGGSLISATVVIGSAHHYSEWDSGKKQRESNFAVAAGKLYRPWDDPIDEPYAQKSDVKEIHLPLHYLGVAANNQEDIAVVVVRKAFKFTWHIRPVCLDFDFRFDGRQLQPGNKGKVAGWGLTGENGDSSRVLKVFDVPYQSLETCIAEWPRSFIPFVTSDKICAGTTDGTIPMCKGDSGGGLAFPESDKNKQRFYLRGVMSTAPVGEQRCDTKTYVAFTHVLKHEHFIKSWLDEVTK